MTERPDAPAAAQQPKGQTALLVIDLQHAYFENDDLAAQRPELLARTNELISAARDAGRPVILVRTEHQPDGSTWTLNMRADGEGFAYPGSRQAAFVDGLDCDGHTEIVKTRDSAFVGTDLHDKLREFGVAHLVLCGVSTHSCVAQTATDAFARDFHVAIACDAVASEDAELSAALLQFLHHEMRQPLLSQAHCLDLLRRGWPEDFQLRSSRSAGASFLSP